MAAFSDFMENAILTDIKARTPHIGLHSASPTDAGGVAEVTTTVRTAGRVPVTFGTVAGGSMSNSAIVDFGAAAAGATVSHFGVYDAASGGNLLMHGALTGGAQTVSTGNEVSFAAGTLTLSVA